MQLTIVANTFYGSKTKLSPGDATRVDQFIQKLQKNPANPGLGLERVQNAADPNMWSARITLKLRAILHKVADRYTILYAGLHDDAYEWAMRHRMGPHPVTGEIQIVDLAIVPPPPPPVTPQVLPATPLGSPAPPAGTAPSAFLDATAAAADRDEISAFRIDAVDVQAPTPPAAAGEPAAADDGEVLDFGCHSPEFLLSLGVPPEWVERVRAIRTGTDFFQVSEKLPEEVGERLYALALGEEVKPPKPIPQDAPLEASPVHAQRFYVVSGPEELQDILTRPFEEWMLFLHPSQRYLVDGDFKGPVKVTGAAGTGKTVVAIHRARALARKGMRVLLTTFTKKLCKSIQKRIDFLCTEAERKLIKVSNVYVCAMDVLRGNGGAPRVLTQQDAEPLIKQAYTPQAAEKLSVEYVIDEWRHVIDAHGIESAQEYATHDRSGRGIALTKTSRKKLWSIYEQVLQRAAARGQYPWGQIHRRAEKAVKAAGTKLFDAVIVDEVQDLSTPQIRLLSAMAGEGPNSLMLVGDAGQRIYPGGFSLLSLGIDCRGRSHQLKINYRTTHQTAQAAARLRGRSVDDLQGGEEAAGVQNLLNGPEPEVRGFNSFEAEDDFIVGRIQKLLADGVQPREIGVFARSRKAMFYLHKKMGAAGIPVNELNDYGESTSEGQAEEGIAVGPMHGAKGLEFRFVFIVACRRKELPADYELKKAKTDKDQDAVIERERNLLYVSMTRARDQVFITYTSPRSAFLDAIDPAGAAPAAARPPKRIPTA